MRSNEVVYFSAKDYFSALFAAIDQAKSEILIETYTFKTGQLSRSLFTKLQAARLRGVRIKMLVDAAGSYGAVEKLRELCRQQEIELRVYHSLLWSSLIKSLRLLNRRNHRKVCIIDSSLAFTGSLNLCDDHIIKNAYNETWKDYGVSFLGDGVSELRSAFDKSFQSFHANKERIKKGIFSRRRNNPLSGLFLNDTRLKRKECAQSFKFHIQNAKKRIWLANAYILPEFKIQKYLEAAAIRGVEVRLLTSGNNSDIFFMPWLMRLYYQRNLKAGIKLYEYLPSFFHGKVFVLDDYISIGSSNLNHRSVFHDLEVDVIIESDANCSKVLLDLEECFSNSKQITQNDIENIPLMERLIARALYLFKYWF